MICTLPAEEILNTKIKKYQWIIGSIIFQYNCPNNLKEDCTSIGKESLIEALETYDESKGKLSSWIFFRVRMKIQNYLSSERIKGVKASRQTANKYSINANNDLPDCTEHENPLTIILEQEDKNEINKKYVETINKLNRKVTKKQRNIFLSYYRNEKSMKQISDEEKISLGNVSEILKLCRNIIKGVK